MQSNVIITGIDTKLGNGILQECLINSDINRILLLINDKNLLFEHPKVETIVINSLNELNNAVEIIRNYNSCFYCDRVSIDRVTNEEYFNHIYKKTLQFANQLVQLNPNLNFCYVSAAGTDNLEQSNQYSSRINGKTENALNKIKFKGIYHFRPAIVQPLTNKKVLERGDKIIRFIYPILRTFNKSYFLTFSELAKAMIYVSIYGYNKHVLEIHDISFLAKEGDSLT